MNRLGRHEINYNIRNRHQLIAPFHRTHRYSLSFIPACVHLWNNLPLGLQSAISINAFKQHYKRTFFVNCNTLGYNFGSRAVNTYHTHFRLGFTSLNHDLFTRSLLPQGLCHCNTCSEESYFHFFLRCPQYNQQRNDLFQKIIPILISGNMVVAGINMNNIDPEIILRLLIYGFEAPYARLNVHSCPRIHYIYGAFL
jgi:hypothetical protein